MTKTASYPIKRRSSSCEEQNLGATPLKLCPQDTWEQASYRLPPCFQKAERRYFLLPRRPHQDNTPALRKNPFGGRGIFLKGNRLTRLQISRPGSCLRPAEWSGRRCRCWPGSTGRRPNGHTRREYRSGPGERISDPPSRTRLRRCPLSQPAWH